MTKKEWIKELDNDELYDLINENFGTFPEEIKLDGPRKILNRDVAEELADGLSDFMVAEAYVASIELWEIRENKDITIMDMSDEDLIEAIEQDPSDYVEDLYEGEVIHDNTKEMGSFDDVSVE